MSEHYIQSQYLLQKISTDFFNDKSDLIRIKETDYDIDIDAISIDSDESVRTLEQNEFDNEYFYLDSDKELSTVFDLCDKESELLTKFTVHTPMPLSPLPSLCQLPWPLPAPPFAGP